jgi:hypothetical protein
MPLYRCTTPEGALDDQQRQEIVDAITRIHCDVTGAPRSFVHVFFFDKSGVEKHRIAGAIRSGRDVEKRTQLHLEMKTAYSEVTGVPRGKIDVSTRDTPASWTMEHGAILPEPGEEEAWLARHRSH